ncbi:MAG: FAD-dependent oxidoreductase, partial [Planctomycetaceae bacterium]|nr:FAD-dependent oxidoreductase [Planctomycetaceae bacterium]
AVELGATIITDDPVVSWSANGQTVRVITDNATYQGAQLVIAAGAWSGQLLGDLGLPLTVLRKPLMWHEINSPEWTRATTFFFEREYGCFYGFPSIDGQTVKLAEHTGGELVKDPLLVDRGISPADCEPVSEFVRHTMKDVSMQPQRHAVCMYTMTPDGHFIVDRHPEHENVVLAAGFSGHGFKFTSVIGEVLADLVTTGKTQLPISFLGIDRPALKP